MLMLQAILEHLHNWFERERYTDEFEITGGSIELPLLEGQYFRILGSVFNDGLHQYPADDLHDEIFHGDIWALAIPKSVLDIAEEVTVFVGNEIPSAFTSESFGGYSYSKATDEDGNPSSWQSVFAKRLNEWRCI